MKKEKIIEDLLSGTEFYNPNTTADVKFKIISWSGDPSESARVLCTTSMNYSWEETWTDMEITLNAFCIREYVFDNKSEMTLSKGEIYKDRKGFFIPKNPLILLTEGVLDFINQSKFIEKGFLPSKINPFDHLRLLIHVSKSNNFRLHLRAVIVSEAFYKKYISKSPEITLEFSDLDELKKYIKKVSKITPEDLKSMNNQIKTTTY